MLLSRCSLPTPGGEEAPLILTEYIKRGQACIVRAMSEVEPLHEDAELRSHSGLFTVDSQYNSNLFFWYFPSERDPSSPLIVWLSGWLSTAQYGVFMQNGPYMCDAKGRVTMRPTYWSEDYDVLYLDTTVGVGYSFTDREAGYCTDQEGVSANLISALTQFMTVFPHTRNKDVVLGGTSYSGKFIPHLARRIKEENARSPSQPIKLKGVFLGNPNINPEVQVRFGEILYNTGWISASEKDEFMEKEECVRRYIRQGQFALAMKHYAELLFNEDSLLRKRTGLKHYYHLVQEQPLEEHYKTLMRRPATRAALHVGNRPYQSGEKPLLPLVIDVPKSAADELEAVVGQYKTLVYAGHLDLICNYPALASALEELHWEGAEEFRRAERVPWPSSSSTEGLLRQHDNLTEVMIRGAGHTALEERPAVVRALLRHFLASLPT